ncbi:DUF2142 domain-containing protein [Enterococcus sp. JM9B]|uniref:DUF2142 domain-containing protein n=1 Tax=Enterococcus sp. JM9B TaxID=1857216 RepID=UPI0013750E72|nr:DUF2142 domain-containing protein [Enterococcus sp. JM9B]KAF1304828.1 hypothetical protein BAU16_01250 [Enterococcus sp. JM9B]
MLNDIWIERVKKRLHLYIFTIIGTFFLFWLQKKFEYLPVKPALVIILVLIFIIFCWSDKAEINVLLVTVPFGIIFSLISPVFEVWDEPAHFTRTAYISEGNLGLSNEKKEHYVTKDVENLVTISKYLTRREKILPNTFETNLFQYKHEVKKEYQFRVPVTNAYGTFSYIPSVIGYKVGNLLSKGNLGVMFYLGRIFNSLFYALCAYISVKISKKWKNFVSFFALQPMAIYISSSFNQDAISYGLILIVIALFLSMVSLENYELNWKYIASFGFLCALLAFTKLPYIVLAGLIFFIPFNKFKNKETYLVMLISILLVITISGIWFILYSRITGLETTRNVDVAQQIQFIRNNTGEFLSTLFTSIFGTITKYTQLSAFAWDNQNINEIGLITLVSFGILLSYPLPEKNISKWTKLGIIIISMIILILIYLSMYLTWTEVGANYISGVQGRYFFGIIMILPIVFNVSKYIGDFKKNKYSDYILQSVMIFLIIWTIAGRIGIYY